MTAPLVKVRVPAPKDGRFKSWARLITGVDRSRKDGYAFQGPWLRRGRLDELPALALVLLYDEVGSRRHHHPEVEVLRVQETAASPRWRTTAAPCAPRAGTGPSSCATAWLLFWMLPQNGP